MSNFKMLTFFIKYGNFHLIVIYKKDIVRKCLTLRINEEHFLDLLVDKEALKKECLLDGCYLIKTDLQTTDASK